MECWEDAKFAYERQITTGNHYYIDRIGDIKCAKTQVLVFEGRIFRQPRIIWLKIEELPKDRSFCIVHYVLSTL